MYYYHTILLGLNVVLHYLLHNNFLALYNTKKLVVYLWSNQWRWLDIVIILSLSQIPEHWSLTIFKRTQHITCSLLKSGSPRRSLSSVVDIPSSLTSRQQCHSQLFRHHILISVSPLHELYQFISNLP